MQANAMTGLGYLDCPWPGEDGGPQQLQTPCHGPGLALGPLHAVWHKHPFGCASHMVLHPDTGDLLINDYRRFGEEVVLLDIDTGVEKARVRSGGLTQGVAFPSPGWNRDLYWSSMGRLARIFVVA